ncbi:2-dehydro-3-deoxy-6-phosphogalactonate aldolase [Massilia endophytica]|uniref:2-dehydro-3-deoxy-6-phosphogalactonate aldolase n=1 Tax=Massilia endophytica TaxID=2899220 RepID=UPI001E4716FD|nr:2-dehydro-3-deoxy-6-phosphogalactonate aldolase [Massilia endophytica]UGQ49151.1 2-dehydro-3-deoxy-6-phosphogalactonate aldolase [Massilia endophytica]
MFDDKKRLPLVAILRGLTAAEAPMVGRVLMDEGFSMLEVPLNRPGAVQAIGTLATMAPADVLVGGGTMLNTGHVDQVAAAGGRLFVAPDCKPEVVAHARLAGMLCAPGVATPTEAFAALDAGAHALKLFPAEMVGTAGLKAMATVLPAGTPLWPVGGVTPASMAAWRAAGATGFGIGSALYSPGVTETELARRAREFVAAWREAA